VDLGEPLACRDQANRAELGKDRRGRALRQRNCFALEELRRLRHEFEIDEAARHKLQVERMPRWALLGHQLAHREHIGNDPGAVRCLRQNAGDDLTDLQPEL